MSSSLIERIQSEMVTTVSIILIISGTIGNLLNCLIFSRRTLRQNPCSYYFLLTSISNLLSLYFGCLTRLLNNFGSFPSVSLLSLYCKVRSYLTIIGLNGSTWFIVCACFDRYVSTSSNTRIRLLSRISIAKRIIVITTIVICLLWCQMFVCFDTNFQGLNCNPSVGVCSSFNNFCLIILYSTVPPILMFSLGWLTIQNIHNRQHLRSNHQRDRYLTILLISQVICVTILSLPVGIQKLYAQFTIDQVKSKERIQIETLMALIVVYLALTNSSISFYAYTLTSKQFRAELKSLFICRKQRRVQTETRPQQQKSNNNNNMNN